MSSAQLLRTAGTTAALSLYPLASLFSQTVGTGLDPSKPISQYVHDVWQIDQGLPQNTVFSVIQGPFGYLWLGTEAGIVRFDGVTFTTFNESNTRGLTDNYVNALAVDRDRNIWAGTWVGGVVRLVRGVSSAMPGAELSGVNYLYEDRSGVMWAAQDPGLARWQGNHFVAVPGVTGTVYSIGETANAVLLFATDSGIFSWDGGQVAAWQPPGGRIEGSVWTVYRDHQGSLWFGTPDGLYHSTDGTVHRFSAADGLPDGGVSAILQTRNGQIWVGTDGGGIARLRGDTFESFAANDGLSDNSVTALAEDREGSLWVGTRHGGLNRFREPILTITSMRQGLSSNVIWSVYGDREQNLWIGTQGGGLDRLRNGQVTTYTRRDGLPGNTVFATLETSDSVLWAATNAGLARMHHGKWERLARPFPQSRVSALTEDATGAVWIGGDPGLYRYSKGALEDLTRDANLAGARVRTIVQDHDGNVWIGTHGQGLLRFTRGAFTAFRKKDGLSNDVVESLFPDEHGLWVGTERGLDLVRDGRITSIPLSDAVYMSDIFEILKDDLGNLWLSSNQGLASASQRELLAAAAGRRGPVDVREIVALDGSRRIEFNGGSQNAGWKAVDGRLRFPSIKGLVEVDPAHLTNNPVPPPVHIERVLVDGLPLELRDEMELPPSGGGLELHYTATSLLIPERVRFRYKLEGYDRDWVDAGNRRVAYYTHVPGGHYRFRVLAANNDGVWNESGAALPFRIRLHFYETWWFYCLIVLVAIGGVVALVRYRTRRVRAQAKQLAGLVDERTGELQQQVAERRLAEERYRHLFDANPQPVWVTDRETLGFLAVNDSASRHYGYTRDEFFAMTLADLQTRDQGTALPEWIRAAGDGWRGTSTWQHLKKDGTPIEVEVAAYAFTFASRPAALIVAADVTARRNLEERLRQTQKMEAVGQLAGGIAHDLNNVLTAVMAHVDLAVTTLPGNAPILRDLTQAQAAAHRGAGMIRKLLGFSRRERLVLRPLQLEQLVAELAPTLERMLPESIDVAVRKEHDLPPIAADAGAVQQMLLNLATNARDAMPEGGRLTISISVATPADELMAAQEWGAPGNYVVLGVSDNGCGMEERVVTRVFEPYFSTKSPEQGTGLGLAMVYGLMKQQLGYVLVASKPGVGTDVRLYFPITSEAVTPPSPESRQTVRSGNQTVLVVEDQEAVRIAAMRALTQFGYRVLAAADGEEGLRLWRANSETIDLVISDAIMPRMGGLALFNIVSHERPGVRFLLTSGYTGEEVRKSAPTFVELPFLSKPWTVNELLTSVRSVLAPV